MKLSKDSRGIAHLYIILAILLALAIGFAGWRVWESRRADEAVDAPVPAAVEEPEDPVTYAQPENEDYRVALPDTWVTGTCPESPYLLFLAPTSDKLGKCNTESGGTVAISWTEGNTGYGEDFYTSDPYYGGVTYTPMTVDGIEGYKVAYTVAEADELGYPPVGTERVEYVFFKEQGTYTIVYTRFAGDADHSAEAQAIAESFDVL